MTRPWIRAIPPDEAEGRLKSLYARVAGPQGQVDNILQVHSLRPHTLEGHLALYKAVLHHTRNRLPRWLLEALGVFVSLLNRCEYCVEHHAEGLRRLLGDDERARNICSALERERPELVFEGRESEAFRFARKLTLDPAGIREGDLEMLRLAGFDDGEILEVNQVVSYFAYANRTVLGLGVTSAGDTLGLAPSAADDEDWGHR